MKRALLFSLLGSAVLFACPKKETFEKDLKSFVKNPFLKLEGIRKAPIEGLCEAVVSLRSQKFVIYTDKSGRYLFLGHRGGFVSLIDLKTKKDLTLEEIEELNRLTEKQIRELEKYVAFTYGKKGKVVYLFTDPECPFCQKLEPTLKRLADEGKIKVKVILYPLHFHPHAKEKAVAIVCKNIGWQGLQEDYWTENRTESLGKWQCKKGKELVEESLKIARKYGIDGTPTIITAEGKKIVGALSEEKLKKELGLK